MWRVIGTFLVHQDLLRMRCVCVASAKALVTTVENTSTCVVPHPCAVRLNAHVQKQGAASAAGAVVEGRVFLQPQHIQLQLEREMDSTAILAAVAQWPNLQTIDMTAKPSHKP